MDLSKKEIELQIIKAEESIKNLKIGVAINEIVLEAFKKELKNKS